MCKCTPNRRTPYCGAPGCEWPITPPGAIAYDYGFTMPRLMPARAQTPISDKCGESYPHMARGVLKLLRRLERERAECLLLLASVARVDAEALGVDVPEQSRVIGREAARLVATFKLTV